MVEPKRVEIDEISSTEHSIKDAEKARPDATRNQSVYSTSGRKVSEWEAMQIAAAGDLTTINAEVDAIEIELQAMNMRSTWYKPLIKFNDPKYFTWLLVGFASMGGLLSGIDQSLISGANLFMPSCKLIF
jgi:hypothetical protein